MEAKPRSETACFGRISSSPNWREVYLIGGGPTLHGFNFERLRGHVTVAVNDAFRYVPWASALFSLDATWIRRRRAEVESFQGEVYLAVAEDFDEPLPKNAIRLLRVRGARGLSDNPSSVCMGGGNSGFGAFNLAYLKGAQRIILLGYDYCHSKVHWFSNYAWQSGNSHDAMYYKWAQEFKYTTRQLAAKGIEVLNASWNSTISCFPKVELSQLPLQGD